jgi:hypothetical protein
MLMDIIVGYMHRNTSPIWYFLVEAKESSSKALLT